MKKDSSQPTEKAPPEKERQVNVYIKYSAMAFQMAGIIGGGVWLGYWLDQRYNTKTPWFTIGIGLFSIFVALYVSLKDFFKKT